MIRPFSSDPSMFLKLPLEQEILDCFQLLLTVPAIKVYSWPFVLVPETCWPKVPKSWLPNLGNLRLEVVLEAHVNWLFQNALLRPRAVERRGNEDFARVCKECLESLKSNKILRLSLA